MLTAFRVPETLCHLAKGGGALQKRLERKQMEECKQGLDYGRQLLKEHLATFET